MHASGTSPRAVSCSRPSAVIRTAIADPHELVVAGLTQLLDVPSGRHRIVTESCPHPPDVVLYGLYPDDQGSPHDPKLHALLRRSPSTVIVTYWGDVSPAVEAALTCGAHGALSNALTRAELHDGIQRIMEDRNPEAVPPPHTSCHPEIARVGLTPRELNVLALIAGGLTNQEIAERLYLTINSVKTHIRGAYPKIGARRRSHAVVWASRHGLIRESSPA